MQVETHAPRLSLRRKSVYTPSAESETISRAVMAARGIEKWIPVLLGDSIVAMVKGYVSRPVVEVWLPPSPMKIDSPLSAAITTYNGVQSAISGGQVFQQTFAISATSAVVAGNWYDLWPVTGATKTAGGYTGTASTAVPYTNTNSTLTSLPSVSPSTLYVSGWLQNISAGSPVMLLYDRVLSYDSCPVTAGTTTMTNTLPAGRYISAGQPGLQMCFTAQTAFATGANTFTNIAYTDNNGNPTAAVNTPLSMVGSAVAIIAPSITLGARVLAPTTGAGGTLHYSPFIPLAPTTTGARALTNFTCSAANTGLICAVMMFPVCYIPVSTSTATVQLETLSQVAYLPIINQNACAELAWWTPATTGFTGFGTLNFLWG